LERLVLDGSKPGSVFSAGKSVGHQPKGEASSLIRAGNETYEADVA